MRFTLSAVFLSMLLLTAGYGAAQTDGVYSTESSAEEAAAGTQVENESAEAPAAEEAPKGPVMVNNKICPVSGEEIGSMGEGVTREYNGKIYSFCCAHCLNDFDLDPEKYVAIVEEAMAKETATGGGADEQMTEPDYQ